MKKSAVTLAVTLLMGMNIAAATENNSSSSEQTYYEILGDMIQNSAIPLVEDILGMHSGRCFKKDTPNYPYGTGLHARRMVEDVGPIGDSYPKYEFAYSLNSSSGYFDDLTESSLDSTTYFRYYASTGEGIIQEYPDYTYQFGVDGDYILLEARHEGKTTLRCYYFLPGLGNNSSL